MQIFQKDQLKNRFKIFARHVLHDTNLFVFTTQLLDRAEVATFFIIKEAKETILDFSQGTVRVICFYFALI